jgi:heptosyltransferase II
MTKSMGLPTTDYGLRTTDQPRTTDHGLRTIMVRAPNWVGDAVMALPALRELRRIFADAQITFIARPWVAGLFEGEGLADNLIPVHDGQGIFQSASNFITEARQLRREKFDLAVLLQNAFGAALMAKVGGAKRIAGYATDGRRRLLDLVIPFEPEYKNAHQVRYYLNVAATLEQELTGKSNVNFETAQPRLHVSDEQREVGRRMLEETLEKRDGETRRRGDGASRHRVAQWPSHPVAPSPILALSPGATNSRAKRWLAERFASTADRLAEQDGFQTVIVGTAGDVEVANEVAALMKSNALVLAGRTTIAELKAILACTSLVISNDTGTAHVSAALGVPTVVVFGPTEHFSTRPLSNAATVVRHDVECSPCMLRECPIDHRCMTRVEVDDVYSAAQSLLIAAAR